MMCKEKGRRYVMKNKFAGIAIVVVLTIVVLVSPVMAGDYLGQFCFEATGSDNITYMMKLGITDMGDNHFQVAGTMQSTPINGNAEIIDGNIEFTLTWAYFDQTYIYSRVAHMQLDGSLNGYLRGVRTEVNSSQVSTVGGVVKSVTYVPCE